MSIRNYPDVPRIYVDLDGVGADFERAMIEKNMTANQLKVTPGAYVNLHPMPGAVDGISELLDEGYFVMLLTKIPSENAYSASEKILWTNKHLPAVKDHIIITPDKGCVGTKRDFLIDDHPEWANAHNFPGTVIKFGGERVSGMGFASDWSKVVKFFRENKDKILCQ
jgi:5'(3')-deoxyribonucleotidase